MKWNGKSGFALILIACGALILMGRLGWAFGHLMSFIIPVAMIVLGYLGLSNGKKFLGLILMVIGTIILLGKLSGLIGIVIAVAMIGYGISMIKKKAVY
jgi:lia operon protein LiaI